MKPRFFRALPLLFLPLLLLFALFAGLPTPPAQAATLTVINANNDGSGSLRQAIADALPGDTIIFDASLSGQTITLTTGEIAFDKHLTIDGSALAVPVTISGNNASRIFNITGGIINLTGLTFANGFANGDNGGAIHSSGATLTISHSTFVNNVATWEAGAIRLLSGANVIQNSTIISNTSLNSHGGALSINSGTAVLENNTIAYNTAPGGGSVYVESGATLTMTNNTVVHASRIGVQARGHLHLINNIIAHSVLNDCRFELPNGAILTNINNLIEDGTCSPAQSGDPQLGALADNGGRTMTMALLPGSEAIDNADDAYCPTADQRGMARHDGDDDPFSICDIGAYEGGSMICGASTLPTPFTFTFIDQSSLTMTFDEQADYSAHCMYVEEIPVSHPHATGAAEGDNLKTGVYWRLAAYDGDRIYGGETPVFTLTLALPHDDLINARLCKYPGMSGGYGWDCFTPSSATSSWVTLDGVSDFSEWAVGENVGPTAVTLQSFAATPLPSLAVFVVSLLVIPLLAASGLALRWRNGNRWRVKSTFICAQRQPTH